MSKPMLVTWPFVMLVLDFWPLKRTQQATAFTTPHPTLSPNEAERAAEPAVLRPPPLLDVAGCERVAGVILSNKHGWEYDNGRVTRAHFPFRKSLATVLKDFAGKVTEDRAHATWQEAVTRTHGAVQELAVADVAGYCVQCWREELGK